MNEQPPQDLAAESAVLGSMLISKNATPAVMEILKPEDFYRPNHATVYQIITDLYMAGESADVITVAAELGKQGMLNKIGAPQLLDMQQNVPSALNATTYATIVKDKARQRRLIELGDRCRQLGYTDATTSEEVDALIAQAGQFLSEVEQPTGNGLGFAQLVEKWRTWQDQPSDVIPTPWPELNKWIPGGGLSPGNLVVVGGRPGAGKSNAGLNIISKAAEDKLKSLVFSVEMDDVEVFSRLLAAGTWSPLSQIIGRSMENSTWERVEEYLDTHKDLPLEIHDDASLRVEEVVSRCRVRKPKVVMVDYAQLMENSNPKWDERTNIAHISRSLKVAAKQLHMVVVLASQLNRENTKSTAKNGPAIPDLTNLAGGDSLGRDADVVLLLQKADDNIIRMHVEKNRNGRTGMIELVARGAMSRVG
ncbi:DnaB-like DNA helicase [Mycobacterium phage Rimmer]|nr:DnaB-like DNA helicase [Mycobacterium phage Rimmer]